MRRTITLSRFPVVAAVESGGFSLLAATPRG